MLSAVYYLHHNALLVNFHYMYLKYHWLGILCVNLLTKCSSSLNISLILSAYAFSSFIEYEKAIDYYSEAMRICPKVATRSLAVLFGNRAACYVKMVMLFGLFLPQEDLFHILTACAIYSILILE